MSLSALNDIAETSRLGSAIRRAMSEEVEDVKKPLFWRAVVGEFLGCMFLVLLGVGAGLHEEGKHGHSSVHLILEAGFFIACIISSLVNVSGAHVNPAVSLGFAVTRDISCVRLFFYTLAQTAGGIVGAALLKVIFPANMHGQMGLLQPARSVSPEQAFVVEIIITFFLVFVIMSLVDKGRKDIRGSAPFIMGLAVSVNIFFAGHVSGGCMNPIRNFGPAVVTGNFKNQWLYWAGPLVGAVIAALLYDKVFSVMAEEKGISQCLYSRRYQAVNTDELSTLDKTSDNDSDSSTDLPRKRPLVESVEKVASV